MGELLNGSFDIDKVSFKIEELAQRLSLPNTIIESPQSFDTNGIVATMITRMLRSPKDIHYKTESTEVPLTWWNHLLDRVVPERWGWLHGKIKYREIKTGYWHVKMCPHIPVGKNVPTLDTHISWLRKGADNEQDTGSDQVTG